MPMKDNTKITLTVGQLRKLVKESLDGDFPKILSSACKSIKFAGIDLADYFYVWYKAEEEGDKERALEMLKKIKHTGENIDQMLDDIRNLNIGDTPSISGWKGGPVTEDNEGGEPTFDISAAIKSGNFKIQGIRERAGANPVNVRMFALCMYQKSDTGWLNLNLVFDMAYAWAMFYDGNRKKDRPWDERRIGSKDGSLLIDDSLVEELKSNPDLHKAIEDHVEYCCKGNAVDEKKDMVFKKLENLKVSGTNRFAQAAIDTSNHEKALKDAVEYCKATYPEIVGGHSTQWYDQGGPGDPWDYDGDNDLSLERTFEIFDIDSKEKVDALAKAGKMSKTVNKGNFSTTYRVVFKK